MSKSHCVWDEPEFQLQSEVDTDAGEVDGGDDAALRAGDGTVANAVSNDSQPKADGEVHQPAMGDDVAREAGGANSQRNDGSVIAMKMNQKADVEVDVAIEPSAMPASRFTELSNTRHVVKLASSSPQNILDDDEDGE